MELSNISQNLIRMILVQNVFLHPLPLLLKQKLV